MSLNVLYEDQFVIVVVKPAGVPSQKDRSGDIDMISLVSGHIQEKSQDKDMPYVGLIHRLDRPVGGIMVFAKTPFANTKLSEQIRLNKMKKTYLTIVCGKPKSEKGELTHFLIKQHNNLAKIVGENIKEAKKAVLEYETLESSFLEEGHLCSLLKIDLKTGRHHQIRAQLAHIGVPIWGDTKYNPEFTQTKEWVQMALFAYALAFEHPKTGKLMSYTISPTAFPFTQFKLTGI